ncbi:YbaK/EbsC family protein [Levilactobacillus bambusae]|uniref:Uncharacterized protein n=1 Tax=Levilactobacillus bambusae TaxID=2024736 RepID=A0A2V1N1N9_9LACO|nr:YbaK/EbsC family protein [Levilactobacillus bambusae]PWG00285.1 hypothetical protein DCM90_04965 [Levilactobacillus bambusae]
MSVNERSEILEFLDEINLKYDRMDHVNWLANGSADDPLFTHPLVNLELLRVHGTPEFYLLLSAGDRALNLDRLGRHLDVPTLEPASLDVKQDLLGKPATLFGVKQDVDQQVHVVLDRLLDQDDDIMLPISEDSLIVLSFTSLIMVMQALDHPVRVMEVPKL